MVIQSFFNGYHGNGNIPSGVINNMASWEILELATDVYS